MPFSTAIITDDLEAYYKFEQSSGNFLDSVAAAHNATNNGGLYGESGMFGNGVKFVGINDFAQTDFSVADDYNYSYNYWINLTYSTSDSMGISAFSESSDTQLLRTELMTGGTDVVRLRVRNDANSNVFITTSNNISDSTWHMVTVTGNVTDSLIYIDGAFIDHAPNPALPITFTNLSIGGDGRTAAGAASVNGTIDEVGIWDRTLTDAEVSSLYNSGAGLELYTSTILHTPSTGSSSIQSPTLFNATVATSTGTLINATMYVWNTTDLVLTSTELVTGTSDVTNASLTIPRVGNYEWNVFVCDSTDCTFRTLNNTFFYGYVINNYYAASAVYQTQTNTLVTNISLAEGITLNSAVLYWNNTAYTPIITTPTTNNKTLTNTFAIPNNINDTVNYYYNFTFGTLIDSSSNDLQEQNVGITQFGYCNATLNQPYLNISFKNETVAQESVSALISSGTFNYYLGDGSINKTLSYTNAYENASYSFCVIPSHLTLFVDPDVTYDNGESGSRRWNPNTQTLTNTTLLQTLYLLPSSQATSISFVIKNVAEQALSGATVNVTRDGYGLIAAGTTDDSGTVNFELDQSVTYTITASKAGYPISVLVVTPAETLYTIVLGQTSTAPIDYRTGVTWTIQPTSQSLTNNTVYEFNMTLSSSFWDVDEYGFYTSNLSGTILNTTSTTSTGTLIKTFTNTGNNTAITLNYYWVINSTYNNGTINYAVLLSGDTQYSTLNFITRLKTYLSSGLLGLENQDGFGTKLVVFMILFLIMAGLSYKFGLTSPEGLGAVLVFLIALFDVGFGLITFSVGAVTHFTTIIAGLAYLVFVIGRSLSQ